MIRWLWTFAVFLALTVLFGALATAWTLVRPKSEAVMRLGRLWSWGVLRAAGVRVRYEGAERACSRLPCVFISNHQSLIDIFALLSVLPLSTRFVAKRSLFRIPFFGWSLAAAGFIAIDRKDRRRAIRSLTLAAEKIRAGRPVVMFAEGTRSRDGRMGPFKRGAFHVALQAGVPVVPIAISGSWSALHRGERRIRPGIVTVRFAPPVEPRGDGPDGIDRLVADVRSAIAARLDPHEAGPGDSPAPAVPP